MKLLPRIRTLHLDQMLAIMLSLAVVACVSSVGPPDVGVDVTHQSDTGTAPPPANVCGDGQCSATETTETCAADCPPGCGDGVCSDTEDNAVCPADCPAWCGDALCSPGENSANCTSDCPAWCGDGYCTVGENSVSCASDCPANCGDGQCSDGEHSANCPADCPAICGDGQCTDGETTVTCVQDCGSWCGDGVCNGTEAPANCASDCPANCGDGQCTGNETMANCAQDCGSSCGDGVCNGSENQSQCPSDCGTPPVPTPATTARYVRITTTQSTSWVSWSEIEVLNKNGTNIALGKSVTASSSTPSGPPDLVVDGKSSSKWNAGDFPPATITIDLGKAKTISEVRLLVAQSPSGLTVHTLSFGDSAQKFTTAHTFSGHTTNGDWLVYPPEGGTPPSGNLPRGIAWVRSNPMFISALTVSTGLPSSAQVYEYYDQFHATAAHMWNDGITKQLSGWQNANHPQGRWMSWVHNDGKSPNNKVIGGLSANSPGRVGYQVGDEPGLNGDGMVELKEIEKGMDAIRAVDPDALLVLNFSFWAKEFAQMLDYYGQHVDGDVYSYDRYSMAYNEHETMGQIRSAALKWNRPYWRYLKSYHDVGDTNKLHETDYRWTAFVGLLYGYTGHTWFVYQAKSPHKVASDLFPSQGALGQQKLPVWNIIAGLNVQMRNLGRAVTQMTSTDVRYVPGQSIYVPGYLTKWKPGAGGDPYITDITVKENGILDIRDLAVGFFSDDDGEIYVMIQNQQHKGAAFPIDNLKQSTVEVTFDFSGAPGNLDTSKLVMLEHVSGSQKNLSLQSAGGAKKKLVHALAAGDPVFFKYATGKPFPLGP